MSVPGRYLESELAAAIEFGIEGSLLDSPVRGEIRMRNRALLTVDDAGCIVAVLDPADPAYDGVRRQLVAQERLTELNDGQYLLPGLVDLHNHAPQWPQMGKALDVSLEVWLNQYTFPLEAKYADEAFAIAMYESLVDAMLANGTTTAVYFATTHLPATQHLVDTCLRMGQRALVGKVAMDHPEGCPDYYRDVSAEAAIDETSQLIEYVARHSLNSEMRVLPVITPRFIPSCTDQLLRGLGELANSTSTHVQTHCSESDWAHGYGLDRFAQTDTVTYDDFGLLTAKTVLAHSNFVSSEDLRIIADRGAAVAHCPFSNFFANAVFPVREAFAADAHVGLGTDISGGPRPSMFSAATNSVVASRVREDGVDALVPAHGRGVVNSRISYAEAFWMATTGGGLSLGLPIGVLEPGYVFDAIVVDSAVPETDLMIWPALDDKQDVLQKILNNAVRRNVVQVWVQGELVRSPAAS